MRYKKILKNGSETDKKILLSWFWRAYVKTYSATFILALVFMTIEGSMMGLLSYSVKILFDDVFIDLKQFKRKIISRYGGGSDFRSYRPDWQMGAEGSSQARL